MNFINSEMCLFCTCFKWFREGGGHGRIVPNQLIIQHWLLEVLLEVLGVLLGVPSERCGVPSRPADASPTATLSLRPAAASRRRVT